MMADGARGACDAPHHCVGVSSGNLRYDDRCDTRLAVA
jgi:hypothetical protein